MKTLFLTLEGEGGGEGRGKGGGDIEEPLQLQHLSPLLWEEGGILLSL